MKDYPGSGDKVMCLYAQGFSVSHYLVYISDRQTFLRFVGMGMQGNWDQAAQSCYGLRNVDELEGAWLKHLRDTKGTSIAQLTKQKEMGQSVASAATGNSGTLVRMTAPPVEPLQPVPVVRGAMPVSEPQGQRVAAGQLVPRPGYLPDVVPNNTQQMSWQMPAQQPSAGPAQQQYAPIPVQLRPPQYQQTAQPATTSPVGYPGR
jgi:hypothetical protein